MNIFVAGHICLDIIPEWKVGNLNSFKPGQTLEMEGINISTGGVVPNTGLALDRLGIPVTLLGKIGDDAFGKIIQKKLSSKSKNLLIEKENSTSYTIVISPPDTDRLFLHDPGVNNTFKVKDINFEFFKNSHIFHFGYPPLMKNFYLDKSDNLKRLFQKAKKNKLITTLDMAMPDPNTKSGSAEWKNILRKALPFVDIFLPSINELTYMLDKEVYNNIFKNKNKKISIDLIRKYSQKALSWGAKIVVIKLGKIGIYMKTKKLTLHNCSDLSKKINLEQWSNTEFFVPSFKVSLVGTTGAGDSAVAGFLASVFKGYNPQKTLINAAGTGACSVEGFNATNGILSLSKLNQRMNSGWEQNFTHLNLDNWVKIDRYIYKF